MFSFLEIDPKKRITAAKALKHKYVHNFRSKKRESNPVPVVHEFEDVEIMTIKDYHKIVEKEISAIEIDLFGSKSVELTLKQKPKSVKKRKTSVKSKNRASTSS
jgi:hypothetical protein